LPTGDNFAQKIFCESDAFDNKLERLLQIIIARQILHLLARSRTTIQDWGGWLEAVESDKRSSLPSEASATKKRFLNCDWC
jgi:hypothetical protein